MKKRLPILNNEIYSKILFLINDKEVYASQIASALGKTQATTQRQLVILAEKNYLNFKQHPEKKKNIRLFSVNWEKIIEDFLNFLKDRKKRLIIESEKTWDDKIREILLYKGEGSINLLDNKDLINLYKNNSYLLILFKESFKQMIQYEEITLRDVFDKFVKLALRPLKNWSGLRLGEKIKVTKEQREKLDLKHLKGHLKKQATKFSKLTDEEIKLFNEYSQSCQQDKEILKKQDKELKNFDNLMEVCVKLSFDPIESKIDREVYPLLIKEILEKNQEILEKK